jgi:hypothetical protein
MEWGAKDTHVAMIALHNCGKAYSKIFELLKALKILQMFVNQQLYVMSNSEGLKTGLFQDT